MSNKVTIQEDERGLLYRKGSYVKLLQPGVYRPAPFTDTKIEIVEVAKPFAVTGKDIRIFLQDQLLLQQLDVVEVADGEYVLHYEDGKFAGLLRGGIHAYWNVYRRHTFERISLNNPEVPATIPPIVLARLQSHIYVYEVAEYETGILFYNQVMQRELKPGRYAFWREPFQVTVQTVDRRRRQLDLLGQEMMTEDKVTLRMNFVCQYKIVDALKSLAILSYQDQLYVELQLILREYVGTLKLDELLRTKQDISSFVLSRLKMKEAEYGAEFLSAGVKDLILPGDIREMMNAVLYAEKKAQANLITRREETASTRSLLNTAKLMDENETLCRLKELEFLEKICDKVGSISVTGGGGLLEQLNSLIAAKGAK
ncbi:slipin family protein [Paenibacillus sp. GCM10023252]|uniref:slipin family protein n=1 Tax=Paenibacillus sp. GCM10023252 TaxID=3252649 RepID=UPI00360CA5A9